MPQHLLLGLSSHRKTAEENTKLWATILKHSMKPNATVTFDPHVTLQTISPPRLSAADKGKGTEGRQDLEMEIAQAIKEGGEEAEITYLVSLWSDQMDSDAVNHTPSHEEVTGRLVTGSQHQEFWE